MENILITGANFGNKGAQAMLLVSVSEIRKRYPNVNIYYTTIEKSGKLKEFKLYALSKHVFLNAFAMKSASVNLFKGFFTASLLSIKSLLKKDFKAVYKDYVYIKLIEKIDLILDVSGFNLSSLFSVKANNNYLKFIYYAQKCNIPVILLPQSFGPFDYAENSSHYLSVMNIILQYPKLIFAREKSGYDLLTQQLGLKNVILSNDLVLQNTKINWSDIFEPNHFPSFDVTLKPGNKVALIPNRKIIDKCSHVDIYHLYSEVIQTLLKMDRTVYLIYHSSEDSRICKTIKKMFPDNLKVILIQQELNCYDYENIISHFDYVVASRFHSIVNAFKQEIPCLGLGWADKYEELFQSLGQQDYVLDMRKKITCEMILRRLKKLDQNYQSEKTIIKNKLKNIQQSNCFNKVFDSLENKETKHEQRENIC